jgi:glycosyltransferase involved in cell wall biosynthesis
MNNHFIIIVGGRNNSQWVESNINSILTQDYQNYEVMYFDDASDDDTFEKVQQLVGNNFKFSLYQTTERKYKTYFFDKHLNHFWDNQILVFLDGDDMFSSENVLSYLNEIYTQTQCWMTYGGMLVWNGGDFISEPYPQNTEIPEEVKKHKAYRRDTWRTSHLKTMRAFLWEKFDKKDLCPNGKYMVGPDDLAIMFSMLEICPPEKVHRVTDSLYIYNHTEQNQRSRAYTDHKKLNIDYESIVRSRKPYDTIPFVMPTLAGGLGNQMFEIATAAALAKDNNAVMLVNNNEHILPNQGRNVNNYIDNIFSRIMFDKNVSTNNIYNQTSMKYIPIKYTPNMKINGHFQCYKFFDHHREYIQKLFCSTSEIFKELHEKYSFLKDYTAIQVRRGDALLERAVGYHPVPTVEYFQEAVKLANPTNIVVFSDDMKWCKENLKFNVPCNFDISQGNDKDYMELYMMAMCKNIIISASTFGWWGAYLNTRADKKVYVPSVFFGPKLIEQGFNIDDLIFPDWIKI